MFYFLPQKIYTKNILVNLNSYPDSGLRSDRDRVHRHQELSLHTVLWGPAKASTTMIVQVVSILKRGWKCCHKISSRLAPDTLKAARQGLRDDEELSIAEGKDIRRGYLDNVNCKYLNTFPTGSLRGFTPVRGFTPARGFTPTRDPSRGGNEKETIIRMCTMALK